MLMLAIHDICRNVLKYVFSSGCYDFYRQHEDVTLTYAGCDITPLIKKAYRILRQLRSKSTPSLESHTSKSACPIT